tara:strand:+ start:224 stop:1012 length:789 start_codon:yes stop_codon:yes gene_type:complete
MSNKRLMANSSFALIKDSMWIGIPKTATTSLSAIFNRFPKTYYEDNSEFLKIRKLPDLSPKKIWCIWRDPWQRWLSAVMQDYELKFDLGRVTPSGDKNHRQMDYQEIVSLAKDLRLKWKFNSANLRNKMFQHSSLYVARYITLLWKLANERHNCPILEIYPISKINDALKTYLNINVAPRYQHNKVPTLNKSHQLNLDRLDMILKEKKFYNKWKEQFEEDINLNEIISQNIKRFNKTEWNEKVLFKYGLHLDSYFKKISLDF